MNKVAFLGCGRGLGAEVVAQWEKAHKDDQLFLSSRTVSSEAHQFFGCDYSKPEQVDKLLIELKDFMPQRIFYFAGGGPYGPFVQKEWKDHLWAIQVTLLTPMRVLQEFLPLGIQQFAVVGSAIAESKADPNAASYTAAKHGLLGLMKTLREESPNVDLRLFSPGYIDTDLLPSRSLPRMTGENLLSKSEAAKAYVEWVNNPDAPWHYRLLK